MRTMVLLLCAAALACSDQPGFDPANWKFTPTVRLKGSKVGGWQEACAYLRFLDDRELFRMANDWKCGIKVGMPLGTEADGLISPELAARLTAAIATEAGGATIHSQPAWIGEDYCIVLRRKMMDLFPYSLGARVSEC